MIRGAGAPETRCGASGMRPVHPEAANSAMASNPLDGPETVAVNFGSKAVAVSAHEASQ